MDTLCQISVVVSLIGDSIHRLQYLCLSLLSKRKENNKKIDNC